MFNSDTLKVTEYLVLNLHYTNRNDLQELLHHEYGT